MSNIQPEQVDHFMHTIFYTHVITEFRSNQLIFSHKFGINIKN